MAKKKRKRRSVRGQRGYQYTSKQRLLTSPLTLRLNKILSDRPIPDDRRFWRPGPHIPRDVLGRIAEIELARRTLEDKRPRRLQFRMRFRSPYLVVVCQRRKSRRETLFRRNLIGKGKGAVNPVRKMFHHSAFSCR